MNQQPPSPPPDFGGWLFQLITEAVRTAIKKENASLRDEIVSALEAKASMNGLMTVAEAAGYARLTESTIRDWINTRKLKAFQAGNRWRIKLADLETAMKPQGPVKEAREVEERASNIMNDLRRQRRKADG